MNSIRKNNPVNSDRFLLSFLLELRIRLFYCVGTFLGSFCLLLPFSARLYQHLVQPLLSQLPVESRFISTTLTAPLFVPVKFTLSFAIFVSMPFIFYQFWLFVAPALYLKEKRLLWLVLMLSCGLFYSGVFFAYQFIMPLLISFFINTSPGYVHIFPDMSHYLDLVLQLILGFGLIFEVPLVIILVVFSGVLTLKTLLSWRRYFIVLSFFVSMLLTPPDVVSQILLAIPLCLLFEIALLVCRFVPIRKLC